MLSFRMNSLQGPWPNEPIERKQDVVQNQLENKFWGILFWICEFRPGSKTIWVVWWGFRFFRCQEVKIESRRHFLGKMYPIHFFSYFLIFFTYFFFPCGGPRLMQLSSECREVEGAASCPTHLQRARATGWFWLGLWGRLITRWTNWTKNRIWETAK